MSGFPAPTQQTGRTLEGGWGTVLMIQLIFPKAGCSINIRDDVTVAKEANNYVGKNKTKNFVCSVSDFEKGKQMWGAVC